MLKLKYLGASAVFLLVLHVSLPAFAEEKPVGRIIGITGLAEMRSSVSEPVSSIAPGAVKPVAFQPWKKVQPRQLVYLKDEFRTGRKSRIRILFSDNSLMALGPNSQMLVSTFEHEPEKKFRKGVMKLVNGLSMYIFNRTQNNKKSSIHIVTPTANVAARGTQGIVSASREKTIIVNEFGEVEVSNIDDEILGKQILGFLQRTDVQRGHPPTPPVNVPPGQYIDAKKMVLGMIGRESDELIEFIEETGEETPTETEEDQQEKEEEDTGALTEEESEKPAEETSEEPVDETSEEPVEETASEDSGSEAAPTEETTGTLDSGTDSLSQELLDTGGTTTTDSAFTESYDLFQDTTTTTSDSCVAG